MTTTTAAGLAACRRAIDEKAIRTRGPLAAIIAAPSENAAVRRASLVLGRHRYLTGAGSGVYVHPPRVAPHDVFAALATFRLLNRRAA